MAVIASAAVAAAFAMLGDLRLIASTTDVAVYFVFIAVNLTVIILRVREPATERPFRSPLSVRRVPVLPILGIGATMLMMTGLERGSWLLGAVLVGAGVAVGLWLRSRPEARSQPS